MNIKKQIFFLIVSVMIIIPAIIQAANIEEYCFSDNYGNQWRFIGGRLGKKAFAAEVVNPGCGGVLVGISTFTKLEDGTFSMTAIIGRDSAGVCNSFEATASFPDRLTSGTGTYDLFPREQTPPASITLTRINCANVPLGSEIKEE